VQQQSPFIRLSLEDSSGSAAGVNAWVRPDSTVAEAESGAATLTSVVGPLSDAVIISRHIVYRGAEDPRPTAPGLAPSSGAGVFVFTCEAPDSYAIVVVPGIRADLLGPAGPGAGILIDLAAPDVVAFADLLISGIYCNPFGVQLLTLDSAFYQWRP